VSADPPYPEDPLLRALAEYWDDIQALADEQQRRLLHDLVAGMAEPDPFDARAALGDLLLDVLPPGHPMVERLRGVMFDPGGQESPAAGIGESFRRLRLQVLGDDLAGVSAEPARGAGEQAVADDFERQVQARLLSLPSLSPDELRRRVIDPADARLIRLAGLDQAIRFPAFQFSASGAPWPVVQEVNEQLDAAADPWGVTCWWVDQHAGLAVAPADLLGRGEDDRLRRAAAAVGVD
jgi:hypothetical protein